MIYSDEKLEDNTRDHGKMTKYVDERERKAELTHIWLHSNAAPRNERTRPARNQNKNAPLNKGKGKNMNRPYAEDADLHTIQHRPRDKSDGGHFDHEHIDHTDHVHDEYHLEIYPVVDWASGWMNYQVDVNVTTTTSKSTGNNKSSPIEGSHNKQAVQQSSSSKTNSWSNKSKSSAGGKSWPELPGGIANSSQAAQSSNVVSKINTSVDSISPYAGFSPEIDTIEKALEKQKLKTRLEMMKEDHETQAKNFEKTYQQWTTSDSAIDSIHGDSMRTSSASAFFKNLWDTVVGAISSVTIPEAKSKDDRDSFYTRTGGANEDDVNDYL